MIDLHSHVLPGIDDGPADIAGSLALARVAAAGGTTVLVATPHVNWRYRNEPEGIAARVQELNGRLIAEQVRTADGTQLQVRPGAEIALTLVGELDPAQLSALSLGGGPWLLVEPPFAPVAANLDGILRELQDRGHRLVLAHPERCPAFQRDRSLLRRIVRSGVLTSVTAGSFAGSFGGEARELALALAREGMLHNVASDAHDAVHRPPTIAPELEQAGLAPLRVWLTEQVPGAILESAEVPPRPAAAVVEVDEPQRSSRWRLLRRA
ncbi:MAG TPA: CpsB/CapC family capsule biosynthesis tyrosine phosphatase [Solirubrobacteraceae bacterium]|nr:CpsB/CapC family capsule biosynthesis tyrosine phosphatase [Solirubrobacteraceae bacterium]